MPSLVAVEAWLAVATSHSNCCWGAHEKNGECAQGVAEIGAVAFHEKSAVATLRERTDAPSTGNFRKIGSDGCETGLVMKMRADHGRPERGILWMATAHRSRPWLGEKYR